LPADGAPYNQVVNFYSFIDSEEYFNICPITSGMMHVYDMQKYEDNSEEASGSSGNSNVIAANDEDNDVHDEGKDLGLTSSASKMGTLLDVAASIGIKFKYKKDSIFAEQYKFLACRQGTRFPVTLVHAEEEEQLFDKLLLEHPKPEK
jgi:hypothetical protein